jgi:hypothetical protein
VVRPCDWAVLAEGSASANWREPFFVLFDPDGEDAVTIGLGAAGTAALADGPLPVGDVVAITILIGVGVYVLFAKGGKQNIRDTEYREVPTEKLQERLRDPETPKAEKRRIQKELKARGQRNKRKRRAENPVHICYIQEKHYGQRHIAA